MEPDGPALRYHALRSVEDPLFLPYLDLYETAFPPNERVAVSQFVRSLLGRHRGEEDGIHLLAVTDAGDELVAMARYDAEPESELVYLVYLAVVEPRRGHGLGSRILPELLRRARLAAPAAAALLFEVDDPANHPDDPQERELSERRIRFYRRFGARLLSGIGYTQRVEFHPDGVPMHLMFCPFADLTPEQAFALATTFFGDDVGRTDAPLELL